MENRKWLPADTRARLIDLCKDRNISQAQLAEVIGIDRSALSRFLNGKTDSLSHEHVIKIAQYFNVSTDFLLGETDDPGRINYDIGELGLTVKAAECLYTRKIDPATLCRLLEHERCGQLIYEIGLYLDETLTSGIAVQNQLFNSMIKALSDHSAEHPEDQQAAAAAMQTVHAHKPSQYNEKDRIRSDFDQILQDMKKDSLQKSKDAVLMTKNAMENMTGCIKAVSNGFDLHNLTPGLLIDFIMGQLNMVGIPENVKPEMDRIIARLREDLTDYFNLLKTAKEQIG